MANSNTGDKLPESLGWFREGGNWLVGMSFAALGGLLVYVDKLLNSPEPGTALLVVPALMAYLFAVLSGVLFYFWIASYGNQLEELRKDEEEAKAATVEAKPPLEAKVESEKLTAGKYLRRVQLFHRGMLLLFFLGSAFAFAAGIAQISLAKRADGPWTVETHTYTDATCQCSRYVILRTSTPSGATWQLTETDTGVLEWRAVPIGN